MVMRRRRPAPRVWCVAVACIALWVCARSRHVAVRLRGGGRRAIPRTVWRTWRHSSLEPAAAENLARFEALNPGYEQRLVNDSAAAAFVASRFPGRVARAYASVGPEFGAARADLWRYCVLYEFGGWYLDLDVECGAPLDDLVGPDDEIAHGYEHTRLPRSPPAPLACVGRDWFDASAALLAPRAVARAPFAPFTVAQNALGARPRLPARKPTASLGREFFRPLYPRSNRTR